MLAVRFFAGPHVDDRVRRLFAAGRLHVTRPYPILNFRVGIAGSPTAASHANKLKNEFNKTGSINTEIILVFDFHVAPISSFRISSGFKVELMNKKNIKLFGLG